ncbi:fatty acid desaturase [Caenimonas koreensis]|uniref:Fatty acid desaturase domain-containing protein n=1 Tax=Caenimonas koreensis DSM 17982 TaxID=1121255 RepID=A0A844AWS7_9BURK|nr:fatty acid desaturase [Caenimonas koreensis]MRD48534.1 hypothetical protein [Caenimonas koreensis DSM 17982]
MIEQPQAFPSPTEDETPRPLRELQLRTARALIAKELGAQQLSALHKPNAFWDFISIAGSLALFATCAMVLARWPVHEPLWWLCLIVQGDLILVMAFINHDAFAHRKLLPRRLRWIVSSLMVWPSQLRAAVYERMHATHHRALGTELDSEAYKQDIDTPLRRFLYASPAAIVFRFVFLRGRTASVSFARAGALPQASVDASRERWERGTRIAVFASALLLLFVDWRIVVLGYVLPLVVVTPVFNTIRIVLEHFDLDRNNPLWVGTFYRSGPVSRLLFWFGAGDCHVVHHFYANIPFYRIGRAVELMRPILVREGVYEQRSLLRLMMQWFSASRAHWSVPPA